MGFNKEVAKYHRHKMGISLVYVVLIGSLCLLTFMVAGVLKIVLEVVK